MVRLQVIPLAGLWCYGNAPGADTNRVMVFGNAPGADTNRVMVLW